MVKPRTAADPQTYPQQFDVAAAMDRLGTDRVVVQREQLIVCLPSRVARRSWRRRGLLSDDQAAALAELVAIDGTVQPVINAEAFDPVKRTGRGRPLAIEDPWAAYVALGDVSDVKAADMLNVSVRAIEGWRRRGLIPGGRSRVGDKPSS